MVVTNPKKTLLRRVVNWSGILLIACLIITCNLSNHVDAFKCDIVNGNDHLPGYSSTKAEAMHRGTYVCDVKFPANPFRVGNHILTLKQCWIEQSWRGGFWYETTTKDTGSDAYYNIIAVYTKEKSDTTDLTIMNNKQTVHFGYVQLQDFRGELTGNIDSLPVSDTLRYNVLKRDTLDFRPGNIEGEIVLILQRKHSRQLNNNTTK